MHRTPDCAANRSVSSTSCEVPEAWPRSVFSPLINCIGLTSIFFGETPMATSSPRARRPSMAADIAAGAPTVAMTTLAPPRACRAWATSCPALSM